MLNRFSAYRFCGLYAFDGDMLRNRLLYDRDEPTTERGDDALVRVTYCTYVRDGDPFELTDALIDPRVARHPKRFVVRSYLGVPILSDASTCIGSLCCFDTTVVVAPPGLRRLMLEAAPLFAHLVLPQDAAHASATGVAGLPGTMHAQ